VNKKHYITFHFEFVMSCLMKFKQDKKRMGNRNCPGQHHICQALFLYYSRIFPYFSIPIIIFQTFQSVENFLNIFQTFPGSVRGGSPPNNFLTLESPIELLSVVTCLNIRQGCFKIMSTKCLKAFYTELPDLLQNSHYVSINKSDISTSTTDELTKVICNTYNR